MVLFNLLTTQTRNVCLTGKKQKCNNIQEIWYNILLIKLSLAPKGTFCPFFEA